MSPVLEPRWSGVEARLPDSLEDLRGPVSGVVGLPLHVAWSGLREFNLADRQLRLSLYRIVLNVGQHDDVVCYLNGDILRREWPVLRRLIARPLRIAWEHRFSLPVA